MMFEIMLAMIITFLMFTVLYFFFDMYQKLLLKKKTHEPSIIGTVKSTPEDININFLSKFLMVQYNNVLNYTQLLEKHDDFSIFNLINNVDCRMQNIVMNFSDMSSEDSIKQLTDLENDIICISKYILHKNESMNLASKDILSKIVNNKPNVSPDLNLLSSGTTSCAAASPDTNTNNESSKEETSCGNASANSSTDSNSSEEEKTCSDTIPETSANNDST